jgi:hypothetical protein
LVGINYGTIGQSTSSASVSGSLAVGGLVGANVGTITQSYSLGGVNGSDYSGGLAGQNVGTIAQSYSAGAVTGSNVFGGFVGYNGGTISTSYWDINTSGTTTGIGSGTAAGASGLTTANAKSEAYLTNNLGWSFTGASPWRINTSPPSYPYFIWQP